MVIVGILGYVQFERTANLYTAAWSEEQKMWRAVRHAAPGLQPDTFVLLTGADAASADVIATEQPWGIADAFGLFYPGHDIRADLLVPGSIPSACPAPGARPVYAYPYYMRILPGGILSSLGGAQAPGSRIVVLRYDRQGEGHVTAVSPALHVAGGRCTVASHPSLILHTPTTPVRYRWLVNGLTSLID